jgi:pimeloyl-ACP methyl ester carboxylesterase
VTNLWGPGRNASDMFLARASTMLAAGILVPLAGCGLTPRLGTAPPAPAAAFAAGKIRALAHPGFAHAEAENGLWTPRATLENGNAGIYFLEPYDPTRIPVLFVHGIGGSPRDFRTMIDRLDRIRFQAWVFQYPTGLRLHTAARVLRDTLAELEHKHHYSAVFIVGHSMGGLVSRRYLIEATRDGVGEHVRLLVTFSTPWEGHAWARVGAQFMPEAPGSWTDLSPASDFLASMREPLQHVPHYVFFGFRRGPSLLTSQSSDGTISLSSQLPAWVQEQAERCWGYDADHAGILSQNGALERFNSLLGIEAERIRSNRLPAAHAR